MAALYVVLDPEACRGRDPLVIAEAALRGGAKRVQLRAKAGADRDRLALARALGARCAAHGASFVVNDRADLAVLAQADLLHLGQDDLATVDARRVVGAMPIARSTHDLAQLVRAAESADELAFGPVFATRTKLDAEPVVGLEGLRAALAVATRPLTAIGGIDLPRAAELEHVARVVGRPLAYVAVVSAVCGAEDPEVAARALVDALGAHA